MTGGTVGPYRLDAELGAGGMGKVWRATTMRKTAGLDAGRVVAVKLLHANLLETEGFFKRFLREAEIGKRVIHENVVRTFDCDQLVVDGKPQSFLVMEYVEGQTLRGLADELGRVPEELCRHVGREAARGLAAIHAAGVVHRDVKPENVIITKDHAVKVMDLGVARSADEAARLSQSGVFVGSVQYAAPEQFAAGCGDVDARADLHALGLILYELATAQHPYRADDFRAVMRRVLDEPPRRCAEINPQLSAFLEEVVHTLLAKRREDRFASAADVAQVLDEGERSAWWTSRAREIRAATKAPLRRIRIPRETAVYGRDTELAVLRSLFDRASKSEGQVALVEGEAGIGKSRLVDEFVGRLLREGEDVNFLFGSYPPGGAATASGAFSTAYREHFGEDGSAAWMKRTPILVPAFDAMLRGETTPTGVEPLTKETMQTCFVNATTSLSEDRTTIVLVDDLHFAPEEGRALFAALALAVAGRRILLVGTSRPAAGGDRLAEIERHGATTRIALARLGAKEVASLLVDALRSQRLAEELGFRILQKSDGNPFFVFEILRGLREGQFITRREDGAWVGTRVIQEIELPSSVLELVQARVSGLSAAERDLLDVAACLGYEFDPAVLAEAAGSPRISTLKALSQIERAHRLVRSAGRRFVFDHHQVQEALYGSIPEMLREEYHAALGAALERTSGAAGAEPKDLDGALCVDLAEHFLKGARGDSAKRYLRAADLYLTGVGLIPASSLSLVERALSATGLYSGTERAALMFRRATLQHHLGRMSDASSSLAEAERLAAAPGGERTLGGIWGLRARCFVDAGALHEALDAAERMRNLGIAAGDDELARSAVSLSSHALMQLGRTDDARRLLDEHLPARAGSSTTREFALVSLATFEGRYQEALEHAEAEIREYAGHHREQMTNIRLGNRALIYVALGRLAEARAGFEQAVASARGAGHLAGVGWSSNLAGVLALLGRLAEAEAAAREGLDASRASGERYWEPVGLAVLAAIARERSDLVAAERLLGESLAIARNTEDASALCAALVDHARVLSEIGRRDDAAAALDESERLATQRGPAFNVARVAVARVACLGAASADADRAFRSARDRLPAAERMQLAFDLWRATKDPDHLAEAAGLLDFLVTQAPEDCRESMISNVRLHREIAAAAAAAE